MSNMVFQVVISGFTLILLIVLIERERLSKEKEREMGPLRIKKRVN